MDPGFVEVEIASIDRGCLVFRYEMVALDDLERRLTELRADPDVLALAPVLTEPYPDQVEEFQWAAHRLQIPDAHDWDWPTGRDVLVAIADTGIDADHPDVRDRVVSRLTYEGDVGGDRNGHGTHVAGIVGATGGNEAGIVGVAPGVEFLDAPVLASEGNPPTPADGIRWAVNNGADVINMSFGIRPVPRRSVWDRLLGIEQAGSVTESLEVALVYAEEQDVVLVASGGNCGDERSLSLNCEGEKNVTTMPAASPSVWAVAATTPLDERASFSTEREYIDLAAPGEEILSLRPGGSTRRLSGTSQAAPHVAGAFALFLGSDGPFAELDETDRAYSATTSILGNVKDLGTPGHDVSFGEGRLDIAAALASAGWVISNPFEGRWEGHSRALEIEDDGTARYVYRLYSQGFRHAEIELRLTEIGARRAEAVVTSSNRPQDFAVSDQVSLVLHPSDHTIELRNERSGYFDLLCGQGSEPGFCGA